MIINGTVVTNKSDYNCENPWVIIDWIMKNNVTQNLKMTYMPITDILRMRNHITKD